MVKFRKINCSMTYLSIFYGSCLVSIIFVLLAAAGSLVLINKSATFVSEDNECWEGNAIAMFGEDNYLICPNTRVVASIKIIDTTKKITAYKTKQIPQLNEKKILKHDTHLKFSERGGDDFFKFYLNAGSNITLSFWNVNELHPISLSINGNKWATITRSTNATMRITKDDAYKVKLSANGEVDAKLLFTIEEKVYSGSLFDISSKDNEKACAFGVNCKFDFTFGSDECVNIYYTRLHVWDRNFNGHCIIIASEAHDSLWSAIIIPCSIVVILLLMSIVAAVTVCQKKIQEENAYRKLKQEDLLEEDDDDDDDNNNDNYHSYF